MNHHVTATELKQVVDLDIFLAYGNNPMRLMLKIDLPAQSHITRDRLAKTQPALILQ